MKVALCVILCKIIRFIGRLFGKGSSKPGEIVLKLYPDIISKLQLPKNIVAITGSNGKTSTVEMIVRVLQSAGKKVVWNKEGSNQTQGIATMLLSNSNLNGKVKGDYIILETDERYARLTFQFIKPTHFVVLNILRDQMTRNGHPEFVFDKINESISEGMSLILNGDDPLTMKLANGKFATTFGFAASSYYNNEPIGMYDDGAYCPICGNKLFYSYRIMGTLGGFCCNSCGFKRKEPKYEITEINVNNGDLTIRDTKSHTMKCGINAVYHAYNMLAAYAVSAELGIQSDSIQNGISDYYLRNGRIRCWDYSKQYILLLTSKHENTTSYDWSLEYAVRKGGDVLIIVDAVSRKYFTSETSWLWDINFDKLSSPSITHVYLAGKYLWDLAQRMEYSSIDADKIVLLKKLDDISTLFNGINKNLIVVTCFSDREKFIKLIPEQAVEREALVK